MPACWLVRALRLRLGRAQVEVGLAVAHGTCEGRSRCMRCRHGSYGIRSRRRSVGERGCRAGKLLGNIAPEMEDAGDADRDKLAITPEQKAVLERVKASIDDLKNWDYFTTERYVTVYSWAKGQSRAAARAHAVRAARSLTTCHELYGARFPPYQGFAMPYGVLRVCGDRETFAKYSAGAPQGVIGWYSRSSGELALFRERDDDIPKGSTEDVLYHEGWHQYSHAYSGCTMRRGSRRAWATISPRSAARKASGIAEDSTCARCAALHSALLGGAGCRRAAERLV